MNKNGGFEVSFNKMKDVFDNFKNHNTICDFFNYIRLKKMLHDDGACMECDGFFVFDKSFEEEETEEEYEERGEYTIPITYNESNKSITMRCSECGVEIKIYNAKFIEKLGDEDVKKDLKDYKYLEKKYNKEINFKEINIKEIYFHGYDYCQDCEDGDCESCKHYNQQKSIYDLYNEYKEKQIEEHVKKINAELLEIEKLDENMYLRIFLKYQGVNKKISINSESLKLYTNYDNSEIILKYDPTL